MRCPDCKNGEGYKEITVYDYDIKRTVKEWCATCKGNGHIPPIITMERFCSVKVVAEDT